MAQILIYAYGMSNEIGKRGRSHSSMNGFLGFSNHELSANIGSGYPKLNELDAFSTEATKYMRYAL